MPILPLDLQIMFGRLNQVGKEQADQKEIAHLQQTLQGNALVEETEHQSHAVNESHDLGEGIEKSNDESKQKNGEHDRTAKEKKKLKSDSSEKEIFKDPDLGTHIDITG